MGQEVDGYERMEEEEKEDEERKITNTLFAIKGVK